MEFRYEVHNPKLDLLSITKLSEKKWQATLAQHNVALLDAQQPRENALKGRADYLALIYSRSRTGSNLDSGDLRDKLYANDVAKCEQVPLHKTLNNLLP